ncbi:Rossmann-fold NAD(P)-binding domain-containing protein [Maribacter antarcticus]|uniref:ornithine cyclodeaminase n=1 Tax=Maribacter antarcticus TaxID=505250 RepID=UPI0005659CF0|nr:ornithine cyclodeaminase [Maribacter antarcticus]
MTKIIQLSEIKSLLKDIDVVTAMAEGFKQYSNGNTVVPPVGELLFNNPPGDVHIKYGYIKNTDFYVIKIASGFYGNSQWGIPSSQGMMLLFNQKTGESVAVLLDEGHLTDIRTAAAGAVAAKFFAPKSVTGIGILGTGIQAKLQLQYLKEVTTCKNVWVWGRNPSHVQEFKAVFDGEYDVQIAKTPAALAQQVNLIVTTTPTEKPLLQSEDILPGTHITAVGSDTSDKQELDSAILSKADLVIADSIPQSRSRGEIYRAVLSGAIAEHKVSELGTAIQNVPLQRSNEQQISVVDLTGVAVQDIMITTAVYEKYITKIEG